MRFDSDDADDDFDGDGDEPTTIACPHCGADVFDDTEYCPVCNQYMTTTTSAWSGRSWWWIALGLAGIVAVILTLGF